MLVFIMHFLSIIKKQPEHIARAVLAAREEEL
jgi:hypothetical protein